MPQNQTGYRCHKKKPGFHANKPKFGFQKKKKKPGYQCHQNKPAINATKTNWLSMPPNWLSMPPKSAFMPQTNLGLRAINQNLALMPKQSFDKKFSQNDKLLIKEIPFSDYFYHKKI